MNIQNRVKELWLPFFVVLAMMLSACGAAETAVTNPIAKATRVRVRHQYRKDPAAAAHAIIANVGNCQPAELAAFIGATIAG